MARAAGNWIRCRPIVAASGAMVRLCTRQLFVAAASVDVDRNDKNRSTFPENKDCRDARLW
jgi:hypothetical protein